MAARHLAEAEVFLAGTKTMLDVLEEARWDIAKGFSEPRLPYALWEVKKGPALDEPAYHSRVVQSIFNVPERVEIAPAGDETQFYTHQGVFIKDMPISVPGTTEFKIPLTVWKNFRELLAPFIYWERLNNSALKEQYVYFTGDQSYLRAGDIQRRPGCHVDGRQKPGIRPQIIQHQIAVTNFVGTIFYAKQGGLDTNALINTAYDKKLFFRELAQQCEDAERFIQPTYQMVLLNAFCPHEPATAEEDGFRSFFRFSASVIPFMNNDNTRSELFPETRTWNDIEKKRYYKGISV